MASVRERERGRERQREGERGREGEMADLLMEDRYSDSSLLSGMISACNQRWRKHTTDPPNLTYTGRPHSTWCTCVCVCVCVFCPICDRERER